MRWIWTILMAALVAAALASEHTQSTASELLIRDIRIVSPEAAGTQSPTDVLIRDGRIVAIGVDAAGEAWDDAEIIDGTDRFLLPGLIDGHVHLNEIPGMTFEHEQTYPDVAREARDQIPRSYLYHGFTTIIDLNSSPQPIDIWNAHELRPQAYFCGASPVFDGYPMSFMPKPLRYEIMPYFLFDESRADEFPEGFDPSDHSPAAVVERVRSDGGICIKTHHERGFGGRGDLPVPTLELANELINKAHKANLPVLMHANSESSQGFGVQTNVDAFAHGMWTWNDRSLTELHDNIVAIVDRAIEKDIALQPTIQVLYGEQDIHNPNYFDDPRLAHVLPRSLIDWYGTEDGQWWRVRMLRIPIVAQLVEDGLWEELDAPPIARVSAVLGYFAKNDGRLLFGSDTPSDPTFANPPGLNGRIEMDRWIEAGVTPTQIFRAATINNANFYGLADDIGTVEVGKKADLLVTRDNPLLDVGAYDTIEYVITNGEAVERSSLSAVAD